MNIRVRPLITPERFERMPDTKGLDLVDGRLVEEDMGAATSWVQRRLSRMLGVPADDQSLGFLFDSEVGYQCFAHRPGAVRKADVSFVRRGRFPGDEIPDGFIDLVPDLVVEVVSPRDRYAAVEEKIDDYLRAGVPLVWVVNPSTRTVYVYEGGQIARLTAADELTGGPVLPGFRVRVADLFPAPPPAAP